jgi:predicted nucleotidyltransferase component of viral defense system
MIAEGELRRLAATWLVDPMIVDLDYVLGCFLSQWYRDKKAQSLRFKGGTCLRKTYFGDYRFSEDLDFTAEKHISIEELRALLGRTIQQVQDVFGLNLSERPPRIETVSDEYGKESYQARLYYRGPLRWRGDPRAIRLDISHDEYLGLPAESRDIIHPYSDLDLVTGMEIPCYCLAEMLSEKLRALSGQRRYAIARDLYDVFQLVKRGALGLVDVIGILPSKFSVKGLVVEEIDMDHIENRREEFERDWDRNLRYLLPASEETSFEGAWEMFLELIRQVVDSN